MNPPVIGLTTYPRDEQNRFYLGADYVEAIRRAGGMPVLIPPGDPQALALLDRLDGILLCGGGDIDPARYHGKQHETIYNVNAERDATELAIARKAVDTGLPTLGICRGTQVLNVALGGTLHEHLPDVVGNEIAHRTPNREPTRHPVSVQPGSHLAKVLGTTQLEPSSWHHQAVKDPAPPLQVVARAPDGTIEAVEMPSHPWLVAIQFHCELRASSDPTEQRVFDELVKAAALRASSRQK